MYYSTLDWRLGAPTASAVGLDNYIRFFTSPDGIEVWRVTAIFTAGAVIGSMVLGLLIALVLNKRIPGRTAARTAVFSPYVLSGVGVALVWMFIFDPTAAPWRTSWPPSASAPQPGSSTATGTC